MLELWKYQKDGIDSLAEKFSRLRRIVLQLATGGGKTVMLCAVAWRYLQAYPNEKVLILVHRDELFNSTIATMFEWYNFFCTSINKDTKKVPQHGRVYVAMIESAFNRTAKLPPFGMVVIDECHRGEFKKIHKFYPEAKIAGFSATPLSSTKKDPLKNYFDDIVCCIDIPELIAMNKANPRIGLCQNFTMSPDCGIDRSTLQIGNNGEFVAGAMGKVFSKNKHVANTLQQYHLYGDGKKALIFNASIEHSQKVNDYFLAMGYPSRHLDSENGSPDGTMGKDAWRKDCLLWLKNTPGAILNNVGILTTGFDERSIEVVIVNKSTMSLTEWLQMCGRGARPWVCDETGYVKKYFLIIDLGNNGRYHFDWCEPRDWNDLFHNPPKPSKKVGVGVTISCPQCKCLVSPMALKCRNCGYEFEQPEPVYDSQEVNLVLFTKNIDVTKLIDDAKRMQYKDFWTVYKMAQLIISEYKKSCSHLEIEYDTYAKLRSQFKDKVNEWRDIQRSNNNLPEDTRIYTQTIFHAEFLKAFKQ